MRYLLCLLLCSCMVHAAGQALRLPPGLKPGDKSLSAAIASLAKTALQEYKDPDRSAYLDLRFRLRIAAGNYRGAISDIDSIILLAGGNSRQSLQVIGVQYRCFALAALAQEASPRPLAASFADTLAAVYQRLPEDARLIAGAYFSADTTALRQGLEQALTRAGGKRTLVLKDVLPLVRSFVSWDVYRQIAGTAADFLQQEDRKRFIITDSVLIRTRDSALLSAIVVRPANAAGPLPAVLRFSIYAGPGSVATGRQIAAKGYAGVIVYTRGKGLSPQDIEPFEHDGQDAYDAIDWISRQPWCNGKVGMYGGSYLGFTQWAALKKVHPALKTIVPQVAVGIGIDYPAFNGIYSTYMLRWIRYVCSNRQTDPAAFADMNRWNGLNESWYAKGKPFQSIDSLDGAPNAIFQRWLAHPVYDAYWQRMIPCEAEFAAIGIPVLTTTGYFDVDQRGAFYYFTQHNKWNRDARHYLLIGPYDHSGGQGGAAAPEVQGYKIDPVAKIDINELVFQWFDHILKGSPRPSFLKDKITYQVTGANEWRGAPSEAALSNDSMVLFLGNTESRKGQYALQADKPLVRAAHSQLIRFTDGEQIQAGGNLIVDKKLYTAGCLVFRSEALQADELLNGSFSGSLLVTINKKDVDLSAVLYEELPDGTYMTLSSWMARASLAADRTRRQLLTPGAETAVPLRNSFFISRKLGKGSRIVFVLGVNKNNSCELNYGTGKEVSKESAADGKVPLEISFSNQSFVTLPLLR